MATPVLPENMTRRKLNFEQRSLLCLKSVGLPAIGGPMNRDTFPGTNPYARTYAEGPPRNDAHAGSARSLRSIRSRTRQRLHEPRPAVSHETRKRIGQWKAEIKQAAKARHIRPVDRLYADELLAFPSVARGHYNLCSDATMGQRLDVSAGGSIKPG